MAQRSNGRKQAPAYSADTLALRMIAGLALVALGALIFMAVDLRMTGNIFEGLRRVCTGLCGSLAMVLAVLPLWAGGLVIWSTQRKAPVKPWLYGVLCFVALSGFIMLISGGAMEHLSRQYGSSWGDVVSGAYQDCSRTGTGGGGLGAALAWPLWRFTGSVLGIILTFLLIAFAALMAVGLTPTRIKDLITGQAGRRREENQHQRRMSEQEQMAWQQQQMAAWQEKQRQQAQIIEQQQMAQRQAQNAMQNQPGYAAQASFTGPAGQSMTGTGRGNSVEAWQQQMATQQGVAVSAGGSRLSQIFKRSNPEQPAPVKQHKSKIFGRNHEENDGLSDGGIPEGGAAMQAARQMQAANEGRIRMTATGEPIGQPNTQWTSGQGKQAENRNRTRDTAIGKSAGQTEERQPIWPSEMRKAEEEEARRAEEARLKGYQRPEPEEEIEPAALSADAVARKLRHDHKGEKQAIQETISDAREDTEDAEALAAELRDKWGDRRGKSAGRTGKAPGRAAGSDTGRSEWESEETGRTGAGQAAQENDGTAITEADPVGRRPDRKTGSGGKQETNDVGRKDRNPSAKPAVPAVQMTVGIEAYRPSLKLPPKETTETAQEEYWEPTPYYAPPLTDLAKPMASQESTAAEDEMRSRRLEETLASFKVTARVVHVTHGPAISRFELELAAGTKVNKITELEKDIAYGMEATSVRIEAPIPGKSLVGVEVPNRKVSTVTLREVLESEKMQNAKSLLTVALGKDIAGTPIVCDLAKMPHMLIAGQTGSGKSVCINTIINSLLFRASPDEVKLILVDPKVVELQCYNGIPHLLIPVVNDPHKAAAALAWAVAEMMERYDKFAEKKVRNLDGYNAILEPHQKPMSRIVIIIDELADLMMVCKKDVEEYICRLTQLARAAGIHLIVATQRPSVDVITGLIKANIPSRIAFKTASSVDSRTILDRNGSEQLLGWGDMLYLPTGSFAPTRVQGCFLSDEEVNRIADHVRKANPAVYDPNILEKMEEIANGGATDNSGADMIGGFGDTGGSDGNLFEQAVEFAIADGQISTSTLQRRLKIGYARAGRLTDEMEERGIVAAKDGSKPRKCLITREEWEEMKRATEGMG